MHFFQVKASSFSHYSGSPSFIFHPLLSHQPSACPFLHQLIFSVVFLVDWICGLKSIERKISWLKNAFLASTYHNWDMEKANLLDPRERFEIKCYRGKYRKGDFLWGGFKGKKDIDCFLVFMSSLEVISGPGKHKVPGTQWITVKGREESNCGLRPSYCNYCPTKLCQKIFEFMVRIKSQGVIKYTR